MADPVVETPPAAAPTAPPKVPWFTSDQPLWVPEGTVRALLTLMLVGGLLALYIVGKNPPDSIVAMAGTAFGVYFGARGTK